MAPQAGATRWEGAGSDEARTDSAALDQRELGTPAGHPGAVGELAGRGAGGEELLGIEVDTTLAGSVGPAVSAEVDLSGRTSNPSVWAAGDSVRVRAADGARTAAPRMRGLASMSRIVSKYVVQSGPR
jgi:hypothetical protein